MDLYLGAEVPKGTCATAENGTVDLAPRRQYSTAFTAVLAYSRQSTRVTQIFENWNDVARQV